jgi:hypothetical protein
MLMMSNRSLFILAATIGSTIGGFIPSIFGAGIFSGWGIFGSTVGGLLAIFGAYRLVV